MCSDPFDDILHQNFGNFTGGVDGDVFIELDKADSERRGKVNGALQFFVDALAECSMIENAARFIDKRHGTQHIVEAHLLDDKSGLFAENFEDGQILRGHHGADALDKESAVVFCG